MELPDTDVEGSQEGHQMLVVDSDTDVEEDRAGPDVGYPKAHQTTPNVPKPQIIEVETQNADVEGSEKGRRMLVVDSDTDDASDPEVGAPKPRRATHKVPRNPRVETESPNPRAEGPQNEHWTLVADSDTDVEENEVNPNVGCPKTRGITRRDPDVEMKKPNPGVAEPRGERWNREVDSDTDVEDDGLNQRFLCPKSHKTPQNTRKDPTVVMETPNPDVGGLSRGSVASSADSDTDVEDLNALPDVGAPKTRGTTHEAMDTVAKVAPASDVDPGGPTRTNDDPDVKATVPTPDVGTPETQCPVLNVDSDTDVEDNGVIPDVGGVHGCQGASGEPDVAVTALNPDVSSPASPGDGSDTDMEEVAPTPDVRSLRSRIWTRNQPHPDVGGPTTGSDAVVEETDPKRRKSPPKRQSWSPKSPGDTRVGGMVPKGHDSAPGTAVEAPYPDVGARQRAGETPVRDEDPAEPPDVPAVESPPLAPNAGGAGDGAGRDVGEAVAGSDTDPEGKRGGPGHPGPLPDAWVPSQGSSLPPPPPTTLPRPPPQTPTADWSP
ncbi:hypothetical protein FQV24_0015538, partial [Spheniscus mendiculus]